MRILKSRQLLKRTLEKEPVTIDFGVWILNTTQDLLWEEEYDASKEDAVSYSHPCAEIIKNSQTKSKEV